LQASSPGRPTPSGSCPQASGSQGRAYPPVGLGAVATQVQPSSFSPARHGQCQLSATHPWSRGRSAGGVRDQTGPEPRSVLGRSRWANDGQSGQGRSLNIRGTRRWLHLQAPDLRREDKRRGVRVSPPAAASPPGSCPRGRGRAGRASPHSQAGIVAARYELRRCRPTLYAQNSSNSYWS
jgi:hypothetical protein